MKLRTFVIMAAAAVCLAGSAFAANTLTVNAASALNNTGFGMQVALDGPSTNNVYVQSDHPNAESHYLARFFICPSSLALDPNTSVRVLAIGDATLGQHVIGFMRGHTPAAEAPVAVSRQPARSGCISVIGSTEISFRTRIGSTEKRVTAPGAGHNVCTYSQFFIGPQLTLKFLTSP